MKQKVTILFVFALFLFGCSSEEPSFSSSKGDLTIEECDKIGGNIMEGIGCAKEIPQNEMEEMCRNNGMKYSKEFNGCIE